MMRLTLLGFLLVDVPFVIAVSILGFVYGFGDVVTGYLDWRAAHPWTFLVSLPTIILLLVWRRRKESA